MPETQVQSLGRILGEANSNPALIFLPGKSNGQRSPVGYRLWGRKSQTRLSDCTHTHTSLSVPLSSTSYLQNTEPKGRELMGTFNLKTSWTEVVGNLETCPL